MNETMLQKIPPHNIEAEESILSSCLLGYAEEILECLCQDDFYRTAHQKIYSAITILSESKTEIDLITVISKLRDLNYLEEIGGASYLSNLVNAIPVSTSIKYHCKIIKEASQKRQIIKMCHKTIEKCFNGNEVDEIIGGLDKESQNIQIISGSFYKLGDLLPETIDALEKMKKNPGYPGIPCGLSDIDRKFGGFQGSTLYVVGGRPSMGKTAFGMKVSRGAAKGGFPVLQISLEMSKDQLIFRELSCSANVDGERFINGGLDETHWDDIIEAAEKIDQLPIYVDDSPTATIKEIQSKIRKFYKTHGRCLITIDYLDFIRGLASDRKDLEIGTITKGLKAAAKNHNIPIILFVQLNRDCEKRENKRPEIRDLRNSGEIEQDADIIAFLYRDEYYNPETEHRGVAEFIVRKFRNGKIGTVFLSWVNHRTTFENLSIR
jgi:replicative DNA helicase